MQASARSVASYGRRGSPAARKSQRLLRSVECHKVRARCLFSNRTIRQHSFAFPHLLAVLLVASRARGETRVRPAGPSRTVTTSLAIEFRSAAAPRADQTHLQHHAIFGGVARRTEKEVEKSVVSLRRPYSRPDDLRLQPSLNAMEPVPERHASPANHRGCWGCRSIATSTLHETRSSSRPSSCPVHHRARRPLRWCPTTMRSIFSSSANRGI